MKTNSVTYLRKLHILPYLEGCNAVQFTNSGGDIFFGDVGTIEPSFRRNSDVIQSILIHFHWITRIRETSDPINLQDDVEPIPNTYVEDYDVTFEYPHLLKIRSPLTFQAKGEHVELSHITKVARRHQIVESKLQKTPVR